MHATTLAGLVVSVILDRPTCLSCIAAKVGETQLKTLRAIERIGASVAVEIIKGARCRACGTTVGPVYSLPAAPIRDDRP